MAEEDDVVGGPEINQSQVNQPQVPADTQVTQDESNPPGSEDTGAQATTQDDQRQGWQEDIPPTGLEGGTANANTQSPRTDLDNDQTTATSDTPAPGPSVVHGSVWGATGAVPGGRRRARLPPSLLVELLSDSDSDEEVDSSVFYRGSLNASEGPREERGAEAAQSSLENAAQADGISAYGLGSRDERQSPTEALRATERHEICPECGRAFTTKGGLGHQRKRAHLEAYNADINIERSKARWTRENYIMAKYEAELQRQSIYNINERLAQRFPSRSFDAIKSHRRGQRYRDLVKELLEAAIAAARREALYGPEYIEAEQVQTGETEQDTMTEVEQELFNLTQHPPRRSCQAARLWEITKRYLEGQVVTQQLNDYLRDVFSEDLRGVCRAPQRPQAESRRQRKKREYAETQRLFKKAQTHCARKVLDGAVESGATDPTDFLIGWRQILETHQNATVSPRVDGPQPRLTRRR
ncbi:hypothetical protein HPB52_006098 [Rhipicephalus sanguineus]|uniref:Uncharacterized protein n=1 Tax=Rhipicephalus sanguineus TaxID=34632 RepID=A0A9D4PYS3_RHISA|nr:hypothetical protein HPB52_006098 [Rhipicephalus sanguineus]